MIYLITALDAEAKPLYESLRLRRSDVLPYPLYENETFLLIVCGVGKLNAAMGVSALLGHRPPQNGDQLVNIGICASPESFEIGTLLVIHQIFDQSQRYYPDILYTHPYIESPCICVDTPARARLDHPADMESAGVYLAASRFFKLHAMVFLKIVSDHFSPDDITKERVYDLIKHHIPSIQMFFDSICVLSSPTLFSDEEHRLIQQIKSYFTHAQQQKLDDAFHYYRLRFPDRNLPFSSIEQPTSKYERGQLHERLITALVS